MIQSINVVKQLLLHEINGAGIAVGEIVKG